jgi:folate-binding Fe-S cluster repair protein YgfZ
MTISSLTASTDLLSGVARLSHLGVIRAVGDDAATFLQGQLTQDVVSMGLDTARLAAFCNAKGRMQASFVVFKRKNDDAVDEFLMVCNADILTQTLKRLSMFVMRAKVKLTDASADNLLYGIAGDTINSGASYPGIYWSKHDFEGQNRVFLYPGAGFERVLCCVPAGLPPPAGADLPLNTWNWLEVQSGIAMISQPIFLRLLCRKCSITNQSAALTSKKAATPVRRWWHAASSGGRSSAGLMWCMAQVRHM